VATAGLGSVLDALGPSAGGEPVTVEHGRLGSRLVMTLPSSLDALDLGLLLARVELSIPCPTVVVARLGRRWLVVEARRDAEPVSSTVIDIDGALAALGLPRGAATMPLRELEDHGVTEVLLPLRSRRR
jgi:hypothetical protein